MGCAEAPCRLGYTVIGPNPVPRDVPQTEDNAEVMIAGSQRALSSVPDGSQQPEAAPLLCAGVKRLQTLFRNAGLLGGDLVAVAGGIGGLGIWCPVCAQMGSIRFAIGRGRENEKLAKDFGAHATNDSASPPPREDARVAAAHVFWGHIVLATGTSGDANGATCGRSCTSRGSAS